jgi:hypothetical protein
LVDGMPTKWDVLYRKGFSFWYLLDFEGPLESYHKP